MRPSIKTPLIAGLGFATFIIAGSFGSLGKASAETRIERLQATVTKVEVLTKTYIRNTPVEEQVCRIEEVPIYAEGKQGDELGSMIIGGLLGSAVGNAATSKDGAGTIGAVTGALLGREHAKKTTQQGKIIGYRQQDICEIKQVIREERVEEVSGYRLEVIADGQTLSFTSNRAYNSGDSVTLTRRTTYSLN